MDLPSQALLDVLTFLLPGFVTAAVLHTLTPAPKPSPFERVVQALIYTITVQAILTLVAAAVAWAATRGIPLRPWTENGRLVWSVLFGAGLGAFLAWAANTDRVHRLLRRIGLTRQTSFSSEWYGAFCQNKGYVVLHLSGSRRLYGWPEEWSSTPAEGHFVLSRAEWLDGTDRVELAGVDRVMVRSSDVEMVEFMRVVNTSEEASNGRSQGTNATTTSATISGRAGGHPQLPSASVQAPPAAPPAAEAVAATSAAT